jgi:hypothetical protein
MRLMASGSTHSHRINSARTSRSLLHSSACAGSLLGSSELALGPAAANPPPGAGFDPANLSSASSAGVRLANLLRARSTRPASPEVAHQAPRTSPVTVSASASSAAKTALARPSLIAIDVIRGSPGHVKRSSHDALIKGARTLTAQVRYGRAGCLKESTPLAHRAAPWRRSGRRCRSLR